MTNATAPTLECPRCSCAAGALRPITDAAFAPGLTADESTQVFVEFDVAGQLVRNLLDALTARRKGMSKKLHNSVLAAQCGVLEAYASLMPKNHGDEHRLYVEALRQAELATRGR